MSTGNKPSALIAIGAVLAAAAIGSAQGPNNPRNGIWYARLRKPGYTPPGPLIGAAWTVLDGMLCVSGTRLLNAPPSRSRNAALAFWGLNVAGIAGYPWVFFGSKRLGASTALVCGMVGTAAGLVEEARKVDGPSAALSVPLLLWVGFAGILSADIWRRN